MRKSKNIFANIDSISVFLYIALILFGWVNIYASQYNEDITFTLDLSSRYGKQLLFISIACKRYWSSTIHITLTSDRPDNVDLIYSWGTTT